MSPEELHRAHERHTTVIGRVRAYFLTGIVVTAPIVITLYIAYLFLITVDSQVAKVLPADWYSGKTFPGIGLLIAGVFFVTIGWLATNVLGRFFIRMSEYILDRMPIIRTIYNAVKQIFETVMGSQAQAFREVVMVEFPRKGAWTLGFVTGFTEGEIQDVVDDDLINVFVPTAPSPVNGFLLFVPRSDIIPMTMTVEEGIKMVVSVGIITPVDRRSLKSLEGE